MKRHLTFRFINLVKNELGANFDASRLVEYKEWVKFLLRETTGTHEKMCKHKVGVKNGNKFIKKHKVA